MNVEINKMRGSKGRESRVEVKRSNRFHRQNGICSCREIKMFIE